VAEALANLLDSPPRQGTLLQVAIPYGSPADRPPSGRDPGAGTFAARGVAHA
jgi:hypothetical protein